jgi:hypothetical protein
LTERIVPADVVISVTRPHHRSPNGLASTSNDHADRGWRTMDSTVSATSPGWTKKSSGLSGMR